MTVTTMPIRITFLTLRTVPNQSGKSGNGIEERSTSGNGITRTSRLIAITATTTPAMRARGAWLMPS
jgi:hypothetical protein